MAGFGFDTGSKWLNNYYEAWYEIWDTYFKRTYGNGALYDSMRSSLVSSKDTINSTHKSIYAYTSTLDSYYSSYYKKLEVV